ncbi:MAG TPA: hypothetical protein VH519_12865 [Hyphomicrobiaceae bacterium]
MSVRWMTKYGARRVRVELPTLEDALFAAEGLTEDVHQQIHIAAALMQVPEDEARAEAERLRKERGGRSQTVHAGSRDHRFDGRVVVERRTPRRTKREVQRVSNT